MSSIRAILYTAVSAAAVLPAYAPTGWAAGAKEVSKDIIAVQLRRQGYECENPVSAERDPAASKPDEAAWILTCEGVAYKVELVPNQAAKVEKLPDNNDQKQAPQQSP